jgi:hypothetical protein
MMKRIMLLLAATLTAAPVPLSAQSGPPQAAPAAPTKNARHLVVLNKRGENFVKAAAHLPEMRAHRQIYLDLTTDGDIVASGLLDSDPAVGFILFRQGVDEAGIKQRLEADFAVREKIVELEYRYWTIQMGSVGRMGPEPE